MHGFESISPEPLATHTQHDVESAQVPASVTGTCLFVTELAVTAVDSPAVSAHVIEIADPHTRRWTASPSSGWQPSLSSFYELCVMRV